MNSFDVFVIKGFTVVEYKAVKIPVQIIKIQNSLLHFVTKAKDLKNIFLKNQCRKLCDTSIFT